MTQWDFLRQAIADNEKRNSTWSNFAGGSNIFDSLMKQYQSGIDPKLRDQIMGQSSGMIRGGEQAISESFAGSGSPIGAKLAGITALRSNINKGTQENLLNADMNAKQNALAGLFQGTNLNTDIGFKREGLNMQKKAYDDANSFDFGSFMGDLLKTGGTIGASACCFIFMEAYNGDMPYWVRECRDEFAPENTARREGYIKMAKWLVPLMQRSKTVRMLVNLLMIKPLTNWGGWYKKVKGYELSFIYKPFVKVWFKVWEKYA